jgi:hypothetical protein
VRHARNLGMGAAMRSGYAAAGCEYIAHLPADRQVRPQSLLAFLPWLTPETTVVSTYVTPPSGEQRRLLSLALRLVVQGLGGLRVNFAGTYVFHRRWLDAIDLASVRVAGAVAPGGQPLCHGHHPPVRARGRTKPRGGLAADCARVG